MNFRDFMIYFISLIIIDIIFENNYSKMTNQKLIINVKNILIILIMSLSLFYNNIYNYISLRILCSIIITSISSSIIFKDKFISALYYSSVQILVVLIMEILFSPILSIKIDNIRILNNAIFLKTIFSLTISILSMYVFHNKKIIKFIDKMKFVVKNKINYLFFVLIIIMFISIIAVSRAIETRDIYLIIISLINTIFMILSIRITINDKYNLNILNERNKNLKDSFKAYSKTIDDCRELKHNLKNQLYGIKSLLPIDHQEQINIIIKKYNNNYSWIDKIDRIPEGLQGLLYLKQKEALQKRVKIIFNTTNNLKSDTYDYVDLCDVIGLLLDNAIEAASKTKSKIIEFNINIKKQDFHIKIINKFNNTINLIKIGKKNYSTKEYKSGLGLSYIKNINNSKIKVTFKIINDLYITEIVYKNKKVP